MNPAVSHPGSEMAELIRVFDWSSTPLGPIDSWPQSLRIAVDLMLDSKQAAYVAWGPELTSLYNDAYRPILGARHPRALGMPCARFGVEHWSEFEPVILATMRGDAQYFIDRPVTLACRQSETPSWFTFSWTPLRDESRTIAGFICLGSETTERVRADANTRDIREAALRESDLRYRTLFETMDEGYLLADVIEDAHGNTVDVEYFQSNPAAIRMLGSDLAGRRLRDVSPGYEDYWFEIFGRVARTGIGERLQRYAAPDRMWYDFYVFKPDPGNSASRRIAVVFQDISERKRTEEALREAESRLRFLDALGRETARSTDADTIMAIATRMLGQHLGVAVCAYADMDPDEDGFTIRGDWSAPGSHSIIGHYSLSDFGELAVQNLHAGVPLVLNDTRAQLPAEEAAAFLGIGLAATICMPHVIEGRLAALMAIHASAPRAWSPYDLGLLREVTERCWAHIERVRADAEVRLGEQRFRELLEAKVAERTTALQQSEANTRTILETSHLYQGLMAVDGTLLYMNATALAGVDAQLFEVLGMPFWETPWFATTPGVPNAIKAAVARVAQGDSQHIDLSLNLPAGVRLFDFSLRPVKNSDGTVIAMVPEAIEKTARIKFEQALQQAQKMEAIGHLTGGIAHDFNNLLMAVLGSLEILRKRMPQDPALLRLLDNAMNAANRGSSLTSRMLAFARRQELKSQRIDVRELVRGMTELLERSLGPSVIVETQFPLELPSVETDANQLESALLNLVVNSRDAMHGEGRITIFAREVVVAEQDAGLAEGIYVCLSVADDGAGMDPQILARAIDPFFTTKGVGKGTGLGLSMVQGFAEQSGGRLILRSTPGEGTTAELWFPARAAAARPYNAAATTAVRLDDIDSARILVVDDDDLVLTNSVAMLEDLGHSVSAARSGPEALELMSRSTFDIVLTDQAMPQMTGAQLASEIRKTRPLLPIIIATGYAELPPGVDSELPRLSKPFTQRELANAIAQVLLPRKPRPVHAAEREVRMRTHPG